MGAAIPDKMRVDKWLWCVRIYKSRSIATEECKSNHVFLNGAAVKPSTLIKPEDLLLVKKDGYNYEFKVIQLLSSRVGAPIAQTCYENLTSAEELSKYDEFVVRKTRSEFRERGLGRPTKKDRRNIARLKELE